MADNKEIRIGVDASGVKQYESTVIRSNEEIRKSILALQNTSKESFEKNKRAILDEIQLLEKRNRLEYEYATKRAKGEYSGDITAIKRDVSSGRLTDIGAREATELSFQAHRGQMLGLSTEFQQTREQTKLLRELIDTVKQTSKDEIRQEVKDSEGLKNVVVGGVSVKGNGEDIENRGKNNTPTETEDTVKRVGLRSVNTAANVVNSRTGVDVVASGSNAASSMLSNFGGALPVIGTIVAAVVGKALGAFGEAGGRLEDAISERAKFGSDRWRADQSRVFNVKNFKLPYFDENDLIDRGLTMSDWYNNYNELRSGSKYYDKSYTNIYLRKKNERNFTKQIEGQLGFGESADNLMNIIGGTNAGKENVINLLGLKRYGGGNVSGEVEFFRKYLEKTEQDISVLPEILQQFTAATKQLVQQTGQASTTNMASLLGGFGVSTSFKGDLLSSNFSKAEQGFQRSNNNVIQAMQFEAARRAGAKTVWEAQKWMASPFSPQSEGYRKNLLSSIRDITGGGELQERAISNIFGIDPNQAAAFMQWSGGGLDTEKQKAFFDALKNGYDFSGEMKGVQGNIKTSGKAIEYEKEDLGYNLSTKIAGKVKDVIKGLNDLADTFNGNKLKKMMDDLNGYVPAPYQDIYRQGKGWERIPISEQTAQQLVLQLQALNKNGFVAKMKIE